MREILFRGQTRGGEWKIGSLHTEYGEMTKDRNRAIDYRILGMRGECYYVEPSTVGQYTGLTDNNGKKIFEGDILNANWCGKKTAAVTYADGMFKVHGMSLITWVSDLTYGAEVIGNIHDNPELLESRN